MILCTDGEGVGAGAVALQTLSDYAVLQNENDGCAVVRRSVDTSVQDCLQRR